MDELVQSACRPQAADQWVHLSVARLKWSYFVMGRIMTPNTQSTQSDICVMNMYVMTTAHTSSSYL